MGPYLIAKPVVKVWCLPKLSEKKLKDLFVGIVDGLKEVPSLGVKNEQDVLVLFPTDAMQYGVGSEIYVEISFAQKIGLRRGYALTEIQVKEKIRAVITAFYRNTELTSAPIWIEILGTVRAEEK